MTSKKSHRRPVRRQQALVRKKYLDPAKVLLLKQIGWGVLWLALAALFLTGIWYGTRIDALTLKEVYVVDGETVRAETIKEKVQNELDGEYGHFIPRRFAWFYPQETIIEAVGNIEKIKEVKVERLSGTELSVTFSEYKPEALWCGKAGEECFLVDKNGFAFATAPKLSGEGLLRFQKLGEEPVVKTNLMSGADFAEIKKLVQLLDASDWPVTKVEIDAVGDIFYILAGRSELRTSLRFGSDEIFDNLNSVRESEEFEHLKPGNFYYIDLRFGDKLYINENWPEVGEREEAEEVPEKDLETAS